LRLKSLPFDYGALKLLLGLGHLSRRPFSLDRSFLSFLLGGRQLFAQFLHFGRRRRHRLALGSLLAGSFLQVLLLLGQLLLLGRHLLLLLADLLLKLGQMLLLLLRQLLLLRHALLQLSSDLLSPFGSFSFHLDGLACLRGGSFQLAGSLL